MACMEPSNDDEEPSLPSTEFERLSNGDLLAVLDLVSLELERRLLKYARTGPELLEMADEGLALAVRVTARVSQTQSSAAHARNHLQITGVGTWQPRATQPSWSDDPRITGHGQDDEE